MALVQFGRRPVDTVLVIVGFRWRLTSSVVASARRLALVSMPIVVSSVALAPSAADASTWCDPEACSEEDGSVGDPSATTWYADSATFDDTGDPSATTWDEEPSGDPGDPFDPPSIIEPEPPTAPGAGAGQSGVDSIPPEILALVEEAGSNERGDRLDPADLPVEEAVLIGAARLVLGIDALAELGAFRRDPDPAINDAIRSIRQWIPADGLDAGGYRSEIGELGDDVCELVTMIQRIGSVSQPLLDVDSTLGDAELLARLDAGATALFEPDDWLSAAADLLLWTGTDPPPEERGGDLAAVLALAGRLGGPPAADGFDAADAVPTSTTTPTRTTARPPVDPGADQARTAEQPTDVGGGGPGLPILALVGAAVLAAAAIWWLRGPGRRRRVIPPSADSEPGPSSGAASSGEIDTAEEVTVAVAPTGAAQASLEDLLDVSRRMTASLDETDVATIALAEAERLVDGEGGLLATWDGASFRTLCHHPTALFDLEPLGDGSLQRVIETGRSIVQVTDDEPALVEVPMAMAAIPIVAEGRVVGAILVVRVPANPFARGELDGLEMLAPLIGSALLAAETHGSATQLADIDPLSGLNNRRRLTADLGAGADRPLVAVMIDIDHFKTFNDTNGHAAGDEALRQVAGVLADNVRPGDVVYRYGGEEFCILLTDTSLTEATAVAERARAAVEAADIPGRETQPTGRVTISVGLARSDAGADGRVVEQADAALYEAKRGGRNRVVASST